MAQGRPLPQWCLEAIINKWMEGKDAKQIAYEVKRPLTTIYGVRERHPLLCRIGAEKAQE